MAAFRIMDTDPTKVDDVVTFGTYAAMFASINTEFPSSPVGGIDVRLRNSTGVDCTERMVLNNVTEGLKFLAEFSNGFPFVQSETAASETGDVLFGIYDNSSDMKVAEYGAGIIRANPLATSSRHLLALSKPVLMDGWILDGNGVDSCGGITGDSASTITNVLFLSIRRNFEGAIRHSKVFVDHCTFVDCLYIRMSGPVTNCVYLRTGLNVGGTTGIRDGSDFNVYDVPKSQVSYELEDLAVADENSIFGINEKAELLLDKWGGRDVRSTSFLKGVSSTAGPVGANTQVLSPKVTITGNITRGQTFDMVMEGYRAGDSLDDVGVYVVDTDGVAGNAGVEYPCTVTVNEHFLISADAPSTASLTSALSNATVVARPLDLY